MIKQLVFILNYGINFLLKSPSIGCFLYMKVISCVLSVLAISTSCFIVKRLYEKKHKLEPLSKCISRYFKEHVLTLKVN